MCSSLSDPEILGVARPLASRLCCGAIAAAAVPVAARSISSSAARRVSVIAGARSSARSLGPSGALPPLAAARRRRRGVTSRIASLRGGASTDHVHHVAVALWSFSSTVSAGRAKMDVLGCLIVAFFCTFAGSTLRDLLLGARPFWLVDESCVRE